MILTFTPAGIERFFEETLERAYDLTQPCPDNHEEVGARYAEAAPRYGMSSSSTPELVERLPLSRLESSYAPAAPEAPAPPRFESRPPAAMVAAMSLDASR